MFDSRGLPNYPPQVNAWEFPPPPVSPRWKWAAIAAMVLGLIGGSTLVGVAISVGSSGTPGLIDNTALISVIERECAEMTFEVEAMPLTGSAEVQAATIAQQNEVVGLMVARIRDVDPDLITNDPPAEEWLADWGRLVQAREVLAERIREGESPRLEIPTDDHGDDIDLRMNDVFFIESTCEVPQVLLEPYPESDTSDA